ncbi:MAG: flagellar motor protein MotD [Steroidobacteraceae bacterium]
MGRRHRHEEHTNHEAWAIPYGDLITLLLAFFVVMYAISSVNEGKYRVLSDSLVAAFRGTPRTLEPVQAGQKKVGSGADINISIVQEQMQAGQPRDLMQALPVTPSDNETRAAGNANSENRAATKTLDKIADNLTSALSGLEADNLVTVRRKPLWVEVEIKTDLLFASGNAQIAPAARPAIEKVATAIKDFNNPVRVEGHTDNVPIRTAAFPSNWELSAARAGSVVALLEAVGVAPSRLAVIGYGENRPIANNDTAEGRNSNRRVVVVILGGSSTSTEASEKEKDDVKQ